MAQTCRTTLWTKAEFLSRSVLLVVLLLLAGNQYAAGVALDAVSFQLPAPPPLTGPLATNNVLLEAEQIHTGLVGSPHSYTAYGDNMYAVTDRGQVVNVAPCRPVVVATLRTRGCQSAKDCGHLVSIRLSPDNLLLVLDAYRGLFEVHPHTGVVRLLYDARTPVNGRPSVYLNDFAFLNDGTLVFSDASPTFDYDNEFWIRFEGRPDGRLLTYNSSSGQAKEILAGISYPTGVELTDDGKFLLVSEAGRARILRVSLSKDNFLQRSFFSENLPGMPEHIRKSGRGTYWVGLSYPRYHGEVSITDQYSSKPTSRNFLAVRRTKEQLQLMYTKRGLALEVDGSGKILRSFHDPTGLKVAEVLELVEYSAVLYVGTRAQSSTVRIVGSPNSLTVDSLVQVLRGRCQVAEDRIQETKVSVGQQLKAHKNPSTNDQGLSGSQPSMPQNMGPGDYNSPASRRVNITQGLTELHRTLIRAPQRRMQRYQQPSQGYERVPNNGPPYQPEVHNPAPPYQYNLNAPPPYQPAGPQRPGWPNEPNRNPPPQQKPVAFVDPFLPGNGPRVGLPLQRANTVPPEQPTQQSGGSPNRPLVVHSLHKGELVSHVVLGKRAEAALAGNLLSPQVSPSQNEHPTSPPPVRVQNTSPIPKLQVHTVPRQKAPEDIGALGGFLGFIDGNSRAATPARNENQQPKQFPIVPVSMPDQKAPGHIEPLHSIFSPSAHQVDQLSQREVPFPGLDLFTGSQDMARRNDVSANKPLSAGSSSSTGQLGTSIAGSGQKQHGPDVVDKPNVIQSMEMFHPTERPDNSQNNAGVKLGSTFQQKASLLKQGLRQLHQIFQESSPVGQSLVPEQKESRTKTPEVTQFDPVEVGLSPVQRTNSGNGNTATIVNNQQTRISNSYATAHRDTPRIPNSYATAHRDTPRIPNSDATAHKDTPRIPNSDATAHRDTPMIPMDNGVINANNELLTKQPLMPFSRAAAIPRNQPTNHVFDKRFPANTQTGIGPTQGAMFTNTNSTTQASHGQFPKNITSEIYANDSKSSTDVTSGDQTKPSRPSLLSVQPADSDNTRQNMTQAMQMQELQPPRISPATISRAAEHVQQLSSTGKTAPSGYIQVYQSPGQYILIPLTQDSLIQAIRGLSEEQVKRVAIMKTNTAALEQTTAADNQPESSTMPTEAAAPQMKQVQNLTQLQAQRQEMPNRQRQQMPNQPSDESLPGNGQNQSQNSHTSGQNSRIQDPHQQNQPQMHQGQNQRFVEYEQAQPQPSWPPVATLQRQKSEHNTEQTPFTNANFRQEQQERFSSSNNEESLASTQSVNTNATSPPKWFTHNSDQKNGQSTQQFTRPSQQITHPAQQDTQLTEEFPRSTQQLAQPTSQYSQPTQQFVQSTDQFSQPTQQFTHSTSQVSQTAQQFAQSTNQFSQPAQQFNQQTQQSAQSNQHLSQPARHLTQSTHLFSQPTQLYTQPTQQFTQQTNIIPTGYSTSNNAQQSTHNFNTQPVQTYVQQPTQEYNKYPTHQSAQSAGNFSVSRITKFPTHRIPSLPQPNTPFNQHNPQRTGWQQTEHNIQGITLQSPNQTINRAFTQEQIQQTVLWQAPHFTQPSQQGSVQEFIQQKPTRNQSVQLSQQITQQPRQQIRDSVRESEQHSPLQLSQSTGQFAKQPTDGFDQISFRNTAQQLNNNLTPNVTQQFPNHSTQRSSEQPVRQPSQPLNNELSRQESQQPVVQSSQQFNSYLTPRDSGQPAKQSQQFSNHVPSQNTEQPLQQVSQQMQSHSTLHSLEQPVQTSSQHFNSHSTPRNLHQPVQNLSQQFNSHSTPQNLDQPSQTSSQQLNSHSTPHNLDQPVQNPSQQFNSHSTPQNLDQPSQTSSQQLNSHSTPHNLDQPVQNPSQQLTSNPSPNMSFPPASQSEQLTGQSNSQDLEQPIHRPTQRIHIPTHQLNTYITNPTSEQSNQQSQQQTALHPTGNQSVLADDIQTKLIHRTPPLFTQPPTHQSLQYSNNPSSQQHTQHRFITQSSQHLTQQSSQEPKPTDQNNDRSHNMPQPSQSPQQQNDEPTLVTQLSQMGYSSQSFAPQLIQPSQQSSQSPTPYQTRPPGPQVSRHLVNTSTQQLKSATQQYTDYSSPFAHKPTQVSTLQTSQKTLKPTQNVHTETAQYFTYQPTRLFAQPSSGNPAVETEEHSLQITQHISQQASQQAMQPTQNANIDTAQQTSQQTRQSDQPSSQHPVMRTEERLPQFTQQASQQTSQKTMEPTQNVNTETAQQTSQQTRQFAQPSSQHPPMGTEERSPQFTQQASQQTSQQTVEPTQNLSTGTAQQTSQQTRQFDQSISQDPIMGTEERSTQFTQRAAQQTSQQTMEPTQHVNTETAPQIPQQPRQFVQPSFQHPAIGTEERPPQFTQQASQQTSQQTMEPTQNVNTDTAPQTSQQTRQFDQLSFQHPLVGTGESLPQLAQQVSQQTSQQTMELTQNVNLETAQQTSQQFAQSTSRDPTMGKEERSPQFTQQVSQQTSQQTMEPIQNVNTETAQQTSQQTRPFAQPSSQHHPIGTEERLPQFTQQVSQQTMIPAQNVNSETAQQTSQQTRQVVQPSSQNLPIGTEERSPQFTQHASQQTSQQLHQQTIQQSTQMSKQTTQTQHNVNMDTSHYLTRIPPQQTGLTTQTTEAIIEPPNELFTPQPTQDVELQPSKQVPRQ